MENHFLKKLQIKTGFNVSIVNAPANAATIFVDIPAEVEINYETKQASDAYLLFAITKADLFATLEAIEKSITAKTVVWIFYPKAKTALAADLNLMQSWKDLSNYKLSPCGSVAVDEIWTGLRIKPASSQKRSGVGNAEIANNEYGKYVDVANKVVTLPEDLKMALSAHPTALAFYEKLAYSHRKEYVLWIVTAKQEKTRLDRIQKMMEKLLARKKNPSEK